MKVTRLAVAWSLISLFSSCYTPAKITKLDQPEFLREGESGQCVYKFRIGGLQKMFLAIQPDGGVGFGGNRDSFSQAELASMRVSFNSLCGTVFVNELVTIGEGEEKLINLRHVSSYDPDSGFVAKDSGRYRSQLSVANVSKTYPALDCDVILKIEDVSGFTKERGLSVEGGFGDGL